MRTVAGCLLVVGLQATIAAGCGSRDESVKDNGQAISPPASQVGADVPSNPTVDNAQRIGMWQVREQVDPLTDKRKTVGTIVLRSQEQGRYQFELIPDEEGDISSLNFVSRSFALKQALGATVRVTVFDGEPIGLSFQTFGGDKMWATKEGRYRIDDAEPVDFLWLRSEEFANVFSTTIPFDKLLTLKRRLLLTGLRSVDEVFELPRNRSSDSLWRTLEQRAAESRLEAVQSAESTAFARKPGPGYGSTRQSLTGLDSIRNGMSKVDVYLAMGSQGPIMATDGAITEWHYCSTAQAGADDQLATVFFVDGRVVDLTRYRAGTPGDCTQNLKSGDYAEPAAVTALRSKQ